jgi:type II secretory pathway pseudopilin PulG
MITKLLHFFHNKGYSLVEMVIYVSILSIISVVGMNSVLSFATSYRDTLALRVVDNSAIDSLERITRDIRSATSINSLNSTFGTSPGVLSLTTTSNGVSTTTRFYLDSGVLKVDVNGVYSGPLTPVGAEVTSLVFTKMDSDNSSLVKIDMNISGTVGPTIKSKTYHSSVVMKGL